MPRFTQSSQHRRGTERVTVVKQAAFLIIGLLLATVGIYLAWNGWGLSVKFLCSGEVFMQEYKYVDDGNYLCGDGFRVAINRLFIFSLLLAAMLLLVLNFWRITAHPFAGARRIIFVVLSVALSVVPLSAALVGTIMITRLTMNLGVTPMRLLGIATGMALVSVFPIFFWATFRKRKAINPRSASAVECQTITK
jgi:hypothetical protein